MSKVKSKIQGTTEAWEDGSLGTSEGNVRVSSIDLSNAIDESLGLQAISIRLPKETIEAYKLIAAHHGVGYQPLMRDILQRFLPQGLKEVMEYHARKADSEASIVEAVADCVPEVELKKAA